MANSELWLCFNSSAMPGEKHRISRRKLLIGGAAGAPRCRSLHQLVPHQGVHEAVEGASAAEHAGGPRPRRGRRPSTAAATRARPSSRGGRVDHAANGFNPTEILRDFDWGKTTRLGERPGAARVDPGRRRQGDRGRPGRQVPGLDLQRPRARADAALPRGRAAAGPLRQRLRASAHDPLPRAASRRDGRGARDRRRADRDGRRDHLRVQRRAVRPAPLPLPRRPARRAHRPRPLRRVHRRSEAGPRPRPTSW